MGRPTSSAAAMAMVLTLLLTLATTFGAMGERSVSPKATPAQTGTETKVLLHFDGKTLTPQSFDQNSSEQTATANGRPFLSRFTVSLIGTWSVRMGAAAEAQGTVDIALWARSQANAKNAGFRVDLSSKGNNTRSFNTNRMDLTATASQLTASGTYSQKFNPGDSFDVKLWWASDPNFVVGPAAGGQFVYGAPEVDSVVSITLMAHPLQLINVTADIPTITSTIVRCEATDAFGTPPEALLFKLTLTGPTIPAPANIGLPVVTTTTNGSIAVSWEWLHPKDRAKDGTYNAVIEVSYGGNSSNTGSGSLVLDFPTQPDRGGGGDGLIGGLPITTILIAIAAVGAGGGGFILFRRRRARKRAARAEAEVQATPSSSAA